MKKVTKKTEKYVREKTFNTFEDRFNKFEERFDSSARATAKSFAKIDESLGEINNTLKAQQSVLQMMLKEISAIHEDGKKFRGGISSLSSDSLSYDKRINNLSVRVEKLESK